MKKLHILYILITALFVCSLCSIADAFILYNDTTETVKVNHRFYTFRLPTGGKRVIQQHVKVIDLKAQQRLRLSSHLCDHVGVVGYKDRAIHGNEVNVTSLLGGEVSNAPPGWCKITNDTNGSHTIMVNNRNITLEPHASRLIAVDVFDTRKNKSVKKYRRRNAVQLRIANYVQTLMEKQEYFLSGFILHESAPYPSEDYIEVRNDTEHTVHFWHQYLSDKWMEEDCCVEPYQSVILKKKFASSIQLFGGEVKSIEENNTKILISELLVPVSRTPIEISIPDVPRGFVKVTNDNDNAVYIVYSYESSGREYGEHIFLEPNQSKNIKRNDRPSLAVVGMERKPLSERTNRVSVKELMIDTPSAPPHPSYICSGSYYQAFPQDTPIDVQSKMDDSSFEERDKREEYLYSDDEEDEVVITLSEDDITHTVYDYPR